LPHAPDQPRIDPAYQPGYESAAAKREIGAFEAKKTLGTLLDCECEYWTATD
jgi:hypothetical protein